MAGDKTNKMNNINVLDIDNPVIARLIADSKEAVICIDQALRVNYANLPALQLLQQPHETLLGLALEDALNHCQGNSPIPDDRTALETHYQTTTTLTCWNETLSVDWHSTPFTVNGEPAYLLLMEIDETACKQQINTLFENEVIKTFPCSIYCKDLNGKYLGTNQYSLEMANLNSPPELIGKTDFDLPWRDYAEQLQEYDQIVIQTGKEQVFEEPATVRNNEDAWYITTKIPLFNRKNKVYGLLGISIDISSIKNVAIQAEKDAELMRAYIENIVATIPCSIFWKDLDGRYLGCNRYVSEMANLPSPQAIIGKTDEDMPWKGHADYLKKADHDVIAQNKIISLEETGVLQDGKSHTFLTNKAPLKDNKGNIVGVIGSSIDITELKEKEAALEEAKQRAEKANQAKSEFLASMSHDFRTPLNAILGFSEILSMPRKFRQDELQEFIQSIHSAGKMLLQLVEDILDFTKVEAGKLAYTEEAFDLQQMVEDIANMIGVDINNEDVKLIIDYDKQTPRHLIGDPNRLRRIITNLVNNAAKFTDEGHVIIAVKCNYQSSHSAELQIIVEDTGIGIPEEKLDSIFDRFSRVQPSYSSKYKGTGLGLSIVKELVENMDGSINATSTLNEGSSFSVTLPFNLQQKINPQADWENHFGDINTLIIDDHPIRGEVLRQQLGKRCRCIASEQLKQNQMDLSNIQIILVDHEITAVNPLKLNKQFQLSNRTLLLYLTNPLTSSEYTKVKKANYHDCLIKPVQPSEFIRSMIKNWTAWCSQFQGQETLLRQFKAKVLLVEDDPASAKIQQFFLEDLGCDVIHARSYQETLEKMDDTYHIAFIDIGLPDKSGLEIIKTYRRSAHSHIPLVVLSAHTSKADHKAFLATGASAALNKPVTKDKIAKTLVKFLFYQKVSC